MTRMPRSRGGALLRFLLGAVMIIALAAATTAVAGLLELRQLRDDINRNPGLNVNVRIPAFGAPQTLLLIGSDHRAGEPYREANTDTMMLMRIDDHSRTINVLSIPRDLRVQIPEGGTTATGKLNEAYKVGGPNLLLTILKTQVFANQNFHVNHVVDVNFSGFSDLIDAIGCVYADVDHRYYNNTSYTDYSSIDIQPGYQKLCGDNQAPTGALAFVRFRHTDSDIVRNARQQDFIRWAKENYTGGQVYANKDRLLSIFGAHAQTDNTLHSQNALENLLILFANGAGNALKSIPFPAQLQACTTGCYVTASAAAEDKAYEQLITPTRAAPRSTPTTTVARAFAKHLPRKATGVTGSSRLVADQADGEAQARSLGRAGFPVYYPRYIVGPGVASSIGSLYCSSISGNCNGPQEPASEYIGSYPRQYVIHAPGGGTYKSYVMTLVLNSALGYYYTVQGSTWMTPPILRKPTQTQVVGGRKLLEYYNGSGRLSLVAWKTPSAVYWISNTLTDYIPPGQMKTIAASLTLGH